MNAVVQPIFKPNSAYMLEHLEHLFGGYLDGFHEGLVELAWTNTKPDESGRYRLQNARLYRTDQLEELVADACQLNAQPMCNVYIGAALRHPDTAPFGRAQDRDAWALTCLYVDLDDAEAAAEAKNIYGPNKPTMVVLTGQVPHTRAQLWWRLTEPQTDPSSWPLLLRGLAGKLSGDPVVTNPSRVMRLAGSIAWPVKPGRSVELTAVLPLKEPGEAAYGADYMARVFPPAAKPEAVAPPVSMTTAPRQSTLLGMPLPSKSEFFRRVNDLALQNASVWVPAIFGAAAQYQSGTRAWRISSHALGRPLEEDLSIAPNGIVDFGVHDLGDPRQGKRTPIDIMIEHGRAADAKAAAFTLCDLLSVRPEGLGWQSAPAAFDPATAPAGDANRADIFPTLTISEIDALPPPTWLVEGLIPQHGLTFIYGKPGKGKSFVTLDLALRIAHGLDWHGKECRKGGVLYIAGEGKGGYRNRVHGWHLKHGILADSPTDFRLLPRALNFMTMEDVHKLVRTLKSVVGKAALVIIDTVARVLPGAEENASKEMGLFVAACDAVRETCGVAVIGVHHSGKDEGRGMRGSTALEGAGDCVLHLKRDDDSNLIEVITEKQKDGEAGRPVVMLMEKIEWMDGLKQASTLVPMVTTETPKRAALDKAVCRRIIEEIRRAWDAGKPWSNAKQTRRDGRYLPEWMVRQTGCGLEEAVQLVADWLANDVLEVDTCSKKTLLKGLKVVGSID